jgi:hypothetical protein
MQLGSIEVDVRPAQAAQFGSAQSSEDRCQQEWPPAGLHSLGKEGDRSANIVGMLETHVIEVRQISSLIPSLPCRRCSPNAPFARFEMLTAERP